MGSEGAVVSLIMDRRLRESPRGGVIATTTEFNGDGVNDLLDDAKDDIEDIEDDAYGVGLA